MDFSKKAFDFTSILGTGTFSVVYCVRRLKDWKPFALKVQKLSFSNSKQSQMMQREVRILDSLRHPNIIAYHGSWEEEKCIHIIMEFATRGTLNDLMDSRLLPLVEKDAIYLFSQMVLGMYYIHSIKILHRDIKPENIMLTGRNGDVVKLGDFGLSNGVHEMSSGPVGSFNYMAPELFRDRPADFASDIWSMGVVLYEMITKRLPFPAQTYEELVKKVCEEKPRPLNYGTAPETASLVSKVLRKSTLHRATMRHLLLCPYLIPTIIQVNLNVGRGCDYFKKEPEKTGASIFQSFLEPVKNHDAIQRSVFLD